MVKLHPHENHAMRKMAEIEKLARDMGKGSFKYAWWSDEHRHERERGISLNTKFKEVTSNGQKTTFYDTPGHRDYYKQAI
jgi:elongation factor 1-alpha